MEIGSHGVPYEISFGMSQTGWLNPVLPGFHPDPSVAVVGEDIYLATSTFEWFPGVRIYHSRNLANWKLVSTPLDKVSLLDLKGVPDSCGVWAPCLSHDGARFHLVYSVVRSFDGVWKDTPNFLITSESINGPWSDPVFLSSSGFDGSMFHDEDGRKWYTSMLVDHRHGRFFGGIILQEYDPELKQLTGPVKHIFHGTELGKTEGPHLYRIDDLYYLITAEGGTEYGHVISVARAKNIDGPYELHPDNPIITSAGNKEALLQKAGHGDLFKAPDGGWYIALLTARPLPGTDRCTLGRETSIIPIEWIEGWPCSVAMTKSPVEEVGAPQKREALQEVVKLGTEHIPRSYQSLRVPVSKQWCEMLPDGLRLFGRDSLTSTFEQSLLARRVAHFNIEYTIGLRFSPKTFQQMAGLVCYYNTGHYYYCMLVGDEERGGLWLQIAKCDNFNYYELLSTQVQVPNAPVQYLKVEWNYDKLSFLHSVDGRYFNTIGHPWDASILSDDYVREGSERYRPAFTGSFVGFCCQDLSGNRCHADFVELSYVELQG